MLRSVFVLLVCFCLKASFVLGAEETLKPEVSAADAGIKLGDPVGDNSVSDESPNAKPLTVAMASSPEGDASTVLVVKQGYNDTYASFAIYPLIGTTMYATPWWRNQVSNSYVAGLGFEAPITNYLALEIEGTYGDYDMIYATPYTPNGFRHGYALYTAGAHGKLYLFDGAIRPYLGGGMDALYFEGLTVGPPIPYTYDRWVGAAVGLVGLDVHLTRTMSVGVRGTYTKPFLNAPGAHDPLSRTAEAGVLSADYFRFLGSVKVAL